MWTSDVSGTRTIPELLLAIQDIGDIKVHVVDSCPAGCPTKPWYPMQQLAIEVIADALLLAALTIKIMAIVSRYNHACGRIWMFARIIKRMLGLRHARAKNGLARGLALGRTTSAHIDQTITNGSGLKMGIYSIQSLALILPALNNSLEVIDNRDGSVRFGY